MLSAAVVSGALRVNGYNNKSSKEGKKGASVMDNMLDYQSRVERSITSTVFRTLTKIGCLYDLGIGGTLNSLQEGDISPICTLSQNRA